MAGAKNLRQSRRHPNPLKKTHARGQAVLGGREFEGDEAVGEENLSCF